MDPATGYLAGKDPVTADRRSVTTQTCPSRPASISSSNAEGLSPIKLERHWADRNRKPVVVFAAVKADPQPLQIYGQRMEAMFIRLDVNGDGRLESGEVQGQPYLERRLKRRDSRGFLLLEDLKPRSTHPSGARFNSVFTRLTAMAMGASIV